MQIIQILVQCDADVFTNSAHSLPNRGILAPMPTSLTIEILYFCIYFIPTIR